MSVTKTKFIHKKFKNNYISHENQINIKRQKPKYNKFESTIIQNQNELDKLINQAKELPVQDIKKEEKTTDTMDLERKEIKITTKKVVKKTNILKPKFSKNSIFENIQIIINKSKKEKENNIINKINQLKIINKRNRENIINKVSEIHLYNKTSEILEEKNQIIDVKLHSKKNKIEDKEKSGIKQNKLNKNKKLKTVVVHIDKKFDLKNCFDKWNQTTINIELKNALKNKIIDKKQLKSDLKIDNFETNIEGKIAEDNKTTDDFTNFETINQDEKKNSTMNTKSSNNEKKGGKKKRIKIKYIKKNNIKDISINSSKSGENKFSMSEEMNSSEGSNGHKIIRYRNVDEESIDMKSLDPKSTKKPFILRINKVEVKKKILKSNSKNVQKEENDSIKNKCISLYSALIVRHFFQKWKQNEKNDSNLMQKLMRRYIIKSILMNKKLKKLKIHLIKYIFKSE